ncbi:MAG: hypothetical protein OQK12_10040 [Motiliproteus sp.]|nr:hypothetical protein [Motiliproteus sp.]MCW9053278.1 hypothetical protein [Motiliproteus sp.]
MLRLIRYGSVGVLLSLAGMSGTTFFALQSYHRLSAETLVAELSFEQLAPQRFQAELLMGDFCVPHSFLLLGDQWRLDAQFLKWKPWANLLGFDSRYRLERLEGRYSSTFEQNQRRKLAHGLADVVDPMAMEEISAPLLGLFADVQYGSSTYQRIDPDFVYQVFKTPSGLITRYKPKEMERASDGSLVIEINHACARP